MSHHKYGHIHVAVITSDRGIRGPRITARCRQFRFFTKINVMQSYGQGLYTYCSA